MLITINGEADNGKDYVADWLSNRFNLVKIALADPMKRFARQLFGFQVENLWGPSEKRNEILDAAPIWSTALQQLHVMHQFVVAVVPETLGVSARVRAFDGIQSWFTGLRRQYQEQISARVVLQTLGTEWGREVHQSLWVDYLFNVQLPLLVQGYPYTAELGVRRNLDAEVPRNGIVVPDQRFTNELEAGRARGGFAIRIRRLSRVRRDSSNVGIQGHKSELEQRGVDDAQFNRVFEFEEGLERVNSALEEWACLISERDEPTSY